MAERARIGTALLGLLALVPLPFSSFPEGTTEWWRAEGGAMDYKHRLVVRHAVRSQVAARRCQWQTFMGGEHDKRQDQSSALKRSAGQKSLVGIAN